MRLTGVGDADGAERFMDDWNGVWRVHEAIHVRFIESTDGRHEIWDECDPGDPGALRGWRLLDTTKPTVTFNNNDWVPNPLYDPELS